MDIKQLKYFLEIYKLQSFTEAAKSCFLTPQGIHVSMTRLENELGCKLFIRTGSGTFLTEAGEYLLPRAQEIVAVSEETAIHFERESQRETSVFAIFVRGTVELLCLPSISEIKKNDQDASVRFRVEQDLDCMQAVLNGEADLGVCAGPVRSKALSKKLLLSRKNVLVINKKHPLAQKQQVEIDDMKNLELALPREKLSVRPTILELCRRRGFEPDFIENDEPRTAFNCAEMGLQAGVVNEVSAKKLISSFPNVCIVPFSEPEMNWNVYLIKKKGVALTSVAKALEASLLEKAKKI